MNAAPVNIQKDATELTEQERCAVKTIKKLSKGN